MLDQSVQLDRLDLKVSLVLQMQLELRALRVQRGHKAWVHRELRVLRVPKERQEQLVHRVLRVQQAVPRELRVQPA
jgi:hypothetical protein